MAMGPLASVVPGGEPVREQVDKIIQSLEALNPCSDPLSTVAKPMSLSLTAGGALPSSAAARGSGGGAPGPKAGDAAAPGAPVLVGTGGGVVTLAGNWRLMYASNSTTMVSPWPLTFLCQVLAASLVSGHACPAASTPLLIMPTQPVLHWLSSKLKDTRLCMTPCSAVMADLDFTALLVTVTVDCELTV